LLNIQIATTYTYTYIALLINLLDLISAHYAASKGAITAWFSTAYDLCLIAVMKTN